MRALIDQLEARRDLPDGALLRLLSCTGEDLSYLMERAAAVRDRVYGKTVYIRGLIEFSNYCKNDCRYCGIRRSNQNAQRYRLTREEILACADRGYGLGFRTVVLQSGEDLWYSDETMAELIRALKRAHPDCAVTLSLGEKSRQTYQMYFDAGADRYLLRHETADPDHYARLHPPELSWSHRMNCLRELRDIGYQVGAGMMVGSPFQTRECLLADLRFLQEFQPEMVGLGPFIPHRDTPFREEPAGTLEDTLRLLALVRLLLPEVLLPATTALGTIAPTGRERGIRAGANVVMPNLSPAGVRGKYLLYDGKICTGDEAAECVACLKARVASAGCEIAVGRGDHPSRTRKGE